MTDLETDEAIFPVILSWKKLRAMVYLKKYLLEVSIPTDFEKLDCFIKMVNRITNGDSG